jgi:RNA polymerase sigma factor (sigma-70 family)
LPPFLLSIDGLVGAYMDAARRSGGDTTPSEPAKGSSEPDPAKRRALARFVDANMSLILEAARLLRGKGVPFSDLVQEGSLALIGAIDHITASSALEWETFASLTIRERLRSVVDANDHMEAKSRGLLENAVAPDLQLERLEAEKIEKTHVLLAMLAVDQERVVRMRFGIDETEPSTLEAVARRLGIGRGSVSGLESRAMIALRRAAHRLRWTFPR